MGNPEPAVVRVHTGNVINLISETYKTLQEALQEVIANGIDAKATQIEVHIDLYGGGNPKNRNFRIYDNGCGLSDSGFKRVLAKVADSQKAGNASMIGQYGMGLMSFFRKAKVYTFTSCDRTQKGKQGWEGYVTHDLANIRTVDGEWVIDASLASELLKELPWWTTRVIAQDFAARAHIHLNSLEEHIRTEYGLALWESKCKVTIYLTDAKGKKHDPRIIIPIDFSRHGKRFKAFSARKPNCGPVTIEASPLDQPTGRLFLQLGGGLHIKPWDRIKDHAEGLMDKRTIELLKSGYIDGLVRVPELKWDFSRTLLRAEHGDGWTDLLLILEEWVQRDDVRQHLTKVKAKQDEELEQEQLKRVKDHFHHLNEEDPNLLYEILTNLPGSESADGGSTTLGGGKSDSDGRIRLPRKHPGTIVKKITEEEKPKRRKEAGTKRRTTYFGVTKDGGNFVTDSEGGLRFGFKEISSRDRYEWESDRGTLWLNRIHPDYQEFKANPSKVDAYTIAVAEYAIESLPLQDLREQDAVRASLVDQEKLRMGFALRRIRAMS